MSDVLYVIDLNSLVFQVFHAISSMTGPKGQPTNAVFGFTRDLKTILEQRKPTHVLCALDSSAPAVRNEVYAEYKANRAEMPDDLRPQFPAIFEILDAFHVPAIEYPGWEADDVIATVVREAVERGLEVCVVTNDKDARQLLGPHVRLLNMRTGRFLDEKTLLDEWGVRPEQVIDFQALVGDTSDNVPGVPLVGPKKARTLLEQYGTLEDILEQAGEVRGKKLSENLQNYAEQARISRTLVTLNQQLPLEIDWENLRVRPPDRARLRELFTELGFRRFSEEMFEEANAGTDSEPIQRSCTIVDTPEQFAEFRKKLAGQRRFCLDLETTSLNAMQADIVGWAVSWEPNAGFYLPVDGPPGRPILDGEAVLESLRQVLEDPEIEVVNQNIKYDMLVLRRHGITLAGVGLDPMIGDYLLDAGARSHGLDTLAEKYLNHRMIPISDLIGSGKQQKQMFEVEIEKAAEYAVEDAEISWQVATKIEQKLRSESLWELYWELERPLISVLASIEYNGIRVDTAELKRQSDELAQRQRDLVRKIYAEAGEEFNLDSPLQLRRILFDKFQLPALKRTKAGPSTSHDVLEKLAHLHPLPAMIIEHRQFAKLRGTYLDALPLMVNPETGKIHASFNQVVAATGRLSSSEPNLQNIPVRTEEGRRIRKAFIPSQAGWKLICADYSQIELRMLAHFSGDETLQKAFQEGEDIHATVAADIFDLPIEDVDANMRRIAKAVNFGVIYGQSPYGLSEAIGISQSEAARFIESYFDRYYGVDRYLTELLEECRETGYARTILGRRRAITGIRSTTGRQRNLSERTAINTVIQGSAADLIKRAMIHIHDRLSHEESPARMLMQIHDELVFESPAEGIEAPIDLVREEMENALPLDVPLRVEVAVGENWFDAEKQ